MTIFLNVLNWLYDEGIALIASVKRTVLIFLRTTATPLVGPCAERANFIDGVD